MRKKNSSNIVFRLAVLYYETKKEITNYMYGTYHEETNITYFNRILRQNWLRSFASKTKIK